MNLGESVTYLVSEYGWDVFEHLKDYPDEEAAWVVRKAREERHKNKAYDNYYTKVRCEDLATGRVAVFPSVASANRHLGFTKSALQGKFFREKTDTVTYRNWKVTKVRGEQ